MTRAGLVVLGFAACVSPTAPELPQAPWIADTTTFHPTSATAASSPLAARYRDPAAKIIAAARGDRSAYSTLSDLTDLVGNRLAGSPQLDAAIAWAQKAMTADGLDVHTEKVMVPHWVRGNEDAELVAPTARPLRILALGGSIATPPAGITAPVVVVHDFAELDGKAAAIKGAIVLYDVAMPAYSQEGGSHYGETVKYRRNGASEAAKRGAVAALVRSVTARSLRTPHTGAMVYADGVAKIPVASVTTEDAELITRLAARGPVRVHLKLDAHALPDVPSANVIGELRGSEAPDEVVVIGGHLDSWDVGQGAHDDGAGIVTMMKALATLKRLGLHPRRTIRVVAFVNEENGLRGGKGYAEAHAGELAKTVFALESDSGGFAPRGFAIAAKDPDAQHRARLQLGDIIALVHDLGVHKLTEGDSGADVSPMIPGGVITAELITDGATYFDIHHTDADTLDKVNPQELADDVAVVATVAFVIADMPGRLDSPSP